jgi:hypothetical protein
LDALATGLELAAAHTEKNSMAKTVSTAPNGVARAGIIPAMTLIEVTFELQSPLTPEQRRALGEFANTYGLRRFQVDEAKNTITFEYDASRLRQSQVVHALGGANIAVTRIVPQSGAEIISA